MRELDAGRRSRDFRKNNAQTVRIWCGSHMKIVTSRGFRNTFHCENSQIQNISINTICMIACAGSRPVVGGSKNIVKPDTVLIKKIHHLFWDARFNLDCVSTGHEGCCHTRPTIHSSTSQTSTQRRYVRAQTLCSRIRKHIRFQEKKRDMGTRETDSELTHSLPFSNPGPSWIHYDVSPVTDNGKMSKQIRLTLNRHEGLM